MFRHRFDVGTMLRVFELNVKNTAFAKQKNSQKKTIFHWNNLSLETVACSTLQQFNQAVCKIEHVSPYFYLKPDLYFQLSYF